MPYPITVNGIGVWVAVAVGEGVRVGTGVDDGTGLDVAVGEGVRVGTGVDDGTGLDVAVGITVGVGNAVGSGSAVASRLGSTVAVATTSVVGEGSLVGVAAGSGFGASKVARNDANSLACAVAPTDTASAVSTAPATCCRSTSPSGVHPPSVVRNNNPKPMMVKNLRRASMRNGKRKRSRHNH